MVKDHEKDVVEFQKEAISCKDPSLKKCASKTHPMLQTHLQQAREMPEGGSGFLGKLESAPPLLV
jgi:hypothetical protein